MVDILSIYNVIIRHLTTNALQIVASIDHLAMKFSTAIGIGVVRGNQVKACCCYTLTMKDKRSNFHAIDSCEASEAALPFAS